MKSTLNRNSLQSLRHELNLSYRWAYVSWAVGAMLFVTQLLLFGGMNAMPGKQVGKLFFLTKGPLSEQVSATSFWCSRIFGIGFAISTLIVFIGMINTEIVKGQIKSIEERQ